jgi:hypothetical protein
LGIGFKIRRRADLFKECLHSTVELATGREIQLRCVVRVDGRSTLGLRRGTGRDRGGPGERRGLPRRASGRSPNGKRLLHL